MIRYQLFFLVQLLWYVSNTSAIVLDIIQDCSKQTCHPKPGNLVIGRELTTTTQCGQTKNEKYCVVEGCGDVQCSKCNSRKANKAHPVSHMTDSFLTHPNTWWQSSLGGRPETLQLDLQGRFYFTHLVMVFKSSRPAAMVIERSDNFGESWRPYSFYASDCAKEFGMVENEVTDEGAVCTSRYSDPEPCTKGEVIFRSLTPSYGRRFDPYSLEARERLQITNLRINLVKTQQCECATQNPTAKNKSSKLNYFAVYELIVGGTCSCNGHASECVPLSAEGNSNSQPENKIHGKCVCQHNTDGENCEKCLPLYNDAPWSPANALTNEPNACKACNCNGHADTCHFDEGVWKASGHLTGGVCDNCKHNTIGRHCEICKPGFYKDPRKDMSDPDVCIECPCQSVGTSNQPCDPYTGFCFCKQGVAEPFCDVCLPGYYGYSQDGCRQCACGEGGQCDPRSGACLLPQIPTGGHLERKHKKKNQGKRRNRQFRLEKGLGKFANCICPDRSLTGNEANLCDYDYVVRAKILKAVDKGSDIIVNASLKRVFKFPDMDVVEGAIELHPTSWTATGCTCPILLMEQDYLIAGSRDERSGRLIVDENSLVTEWGRDIGRDASSLMRKYCF
ncbi:netrin-4-like [Glandiceps talaboti]